MIGKNIKAPLENFRENVSKMLTTFEEICGNGTLAKFS